MTSDESKRTDPYHADQEIETANGKGGLDQALS